MGTHPIFESDFDCLTECTDQVELANALVSAHRPVNARRPRRPRRKLRRSTLINPKALQMLSVLTTKILLPHKLWKSKLTSQSQLTLFLRTCKSRATVTPAPKIHCRDHVESHGTTTPILARRNQSRTRKNIRI